MRKGRHLGKATKQLRRLGLFEVLLLGAVGLAAQQRAPQAAPVGAGGKAKVSVHPRVKETLDQPGPTPHKRKARNTEKKAPPAEQPKRGRST